MDITIQPRKLSGTVAAPPSKSFAHRMLICAAFASKPSTIICPETNDDIAATAEALHQICHAVVRKDYGYDIWPYQFEADPGPSAVYIRCRESGSTLRFLLPIVGALGIEAAFEMEGRLPQRPLSPLWEEMERMGCKLFWESDTVLRCRGKLRPGHYCIDGSVSSQFISGLMMALPLIEGETSLEITGNSESQPYIDMTQWVLDRFSPTNQEQMIVEGDWSSGAFWLAANALGSNVAVTNLNEESVQGDKAIAFYKLQQNTTVSAANIPDLIPILSVVAAAGEGAVFTDIGRLRLKESNRVEAIVDMLTSLGGKAEATDNTLTVYGTVLLGVVVNIFNYHSIYMSDYIASTVCSEPVTIIGAECVKKSYPGFWEDYARLGGNYEKQLR